MEERPDRIDVLGKRTERLWAFRGRLLDPDEDPVLKQITADAASDLHMTASAVSLVLERLQYFRAATGLDSMTQISRSTDRDMSICQYVVRDGVSVMVTDTTADERVPGDMVKRGIRAYLGHPLHVGGEVVGALCVFGETPREFSAGERDVLLRHAGRADLRLAELSAEQRGALGAETLLRAATRPVFQELRNALWQLTMSIDEIRIAAVEAQRLSALINAGVLHTDGHAVDLGELGGATEAAAHIHMLVDEAQVSSQRLQTGLFALEAAAQRKGFTADLKLIISSAQKLADHYLKLVGGLDAVGMESAVVDASPGAATTQIATALAVLAEALLTAHVIDGKIVATVDVRDDRVVLRLTSRLQPALVASTSKHLRDLIGTSAASIGVDGSTLCLSFAPGHEDGVE